VAALEALRLQKQQIEEALLENKQQRNQKVTPFLQEMQQLHEQEEHLVQRKHLPLQREFEMQVGLQIEEQQRNNIRGRTADPPSRPSTAPSLARQGNLIKNC
jgi:hypothetical protein